MTTLTNHLTDISRVTGTRCGVAASENHIIDLPAFVADLAAKIKVCLRCDNGRHVDNSKITTTLIRYGGIPADHVHNCIRCDRPVGISTYEQEAFSTGSKMLLCGVCLEQSDGSEYSYKSDAASLGLDDTPGAIVEAAGIQEHITDYEAENAWLRASEAPDPETEADANIPDAQIQAMQDSIDTQRANVCHQCGEAFINPRHGKYCTDCWVRENFTGQFHYLADGKTYCGFKPEEIDDGGVVVETYAEIVNCGLCLSQMAQNGILTARTRGYYEPVAPHTLLTPPVNFVESGDNFRVLINGLDCGYIFQSPDSLWVFRPSFQPAGKYSVKLSSANIREWVVNNREVLLNAARFQESWRLLTMDSDRAVKRVENPNSRSAKASGFRLRCRVCLDENQVNLPSHAESFMKYHSSCQE